MTILILTGKHVTDSQTGFRAIRRDVLDTFNLESDGYEIESEITVKSLRNGFNFKETPISVERRKHNFSKLKLLSDGTKILKTIVKASFSKVEHNEVCNGTILLVISDVLYSRQDIKLGLLLIRAG